MMPEIIHSSGDLMMEQRRLISDFVDVLSAPADDLDDCVTVNEPFSLYRQAYNFLSSPEGYFMGDKYFSIRCKFVLDLPLTTEEAASIPSDIKIAHKIIKGLPLSKAEKDVLIKQKLAVVRKGKLIINMERIRGLEYDSQQYLISLRKYANNYAVLKENWADLARLRMSLFDDFKKFVIKDRDAFKKFVRRLIHERIELKTLDNKKLFEIIRSM